MQSYGRQSSYDERWADMMSVLDLQSVLETAGADSSTYADTEWDSLSTAQTNVTSSLALMNNVSMTQPIIASSSTAAVLCPTGN